MHFIRSIIDLLRRPKYSTNNYIAGFHHSTKAGKVHYRSAYELNYYLKLDDDPRVVSYQVEPFYIQYTYKGKTRYYLPDLKVNLRNGAWLIIEIKPRHMLRDPVNKAKFKAAKNLYKKRFKVVTEREIFGR